MKAIRIKEFGGPEAMSYEDIDAPSYEASDVLVKMEASGVNYIDTYQRTGLYPVELPYTLGLEGAGIVEQVGEQVTQFSIGDRVAFCGIPGSYAEYAKIPEDRLVPLPDEVTAKEGAALMLQGMTVHYLTQSTYPLKQGDRCLIHAAAGGVGLLLIQIAKLMGAYVIGTVSTEEKAALAKEAGADDIILYTQADFEKEVAQLTDGKGVNVVYDSVGKTTFEQSINCLSPLGYMVLFGNASGPVTEFNPADLAQKGSLFLTRPSLFHYIADQESLRKRSQQVFQWVKEKNLKVRLEHLFSLADVQEAHRSLEGRKTTGKVLLIH
ncbi:MAG: quinone oxidoreductase [SAR324 cluster bacterium]|nr:quinone oxidoreductase [SAR324 cluster bacterium]